MKFGWNWWKLLFALRAFNSKSIQLTEAVDRKISQRFKSFRIHLYFNHNNIKFLWAPLVSRTLSNIIKLSFCNISKFSLQFPATFYVFFFRMNSVCIKRSFINSLYLPFFYVSDNFEIRWRNSIFVQFRRKFIQKLVKTLSKLNQWTLVRVNMNLSFIAKCSFKGKVNDFIKFKECHHKFSIHVF